VLNRSAVSKLIDCLLGQQQVVARKKAVYFFSHFSRIILKYVQRYGIFVGKQNFFSNFAAKIGKKF
jgi:hypothetical protein